MVLTGPRSLDSSRAIVITPSLIGWRVVFIQSEVAKRTCFSRLVCCLWFCQFEIICMFICDQYILFLLCWNLKVLWIKSVISTEALTSCFLVFWGGGLQGETKKMFFLLQPILRRSLTSHTQTYTVTIETGKYLFHTLKLIQSQMRQVNSYFTSPNLYRQTYTVTNETGKYLFHMLKLIQSQMRQVSTYFTSQNLYSHKWDG
jgi:hypothetical protein